MPKTIDFTIDTLVKTGGSWTCLETDEGWELTVRLDFTPYVNGERLSGPQDAALRLAGKTLTYGDSFLFPAGDAPSTQAVGAKQMEIAGALTAQAEAALLGPDNAIYVGSGA